MTSKLKNMLIIIGIVALAFFGYYLFIQNGNIDLNNISVDNQAAAESTQFLRKLNGLKLIKLDSAIFSDPRFTTLINSSKIVIPVEQGRDNPFSIPN